MTNVAPKNNVDSLKTLSSSEVNVNSAPFLEVQSLSDTVEGLLIGEHNEKEKKTVSENNSGSSSVSTRTRTDKSKHSKVLRLPTTDQMVVQTIDAIEKQIKKTLKEVNKLSSSNISPDIVNSKVIEIRKLSLLKNKLSGFATLAKDFIISVWKQFVLGQK